MIFVAAIDAAVFSTPGLTPSSNVTDFFCSKPCRTMIFTPVSFGDIPAKKKNRLSRKSYFSFFFTSKFLFLNQRRKRFDRIFSSSLMKTLTNKRRSERSWSKSCSNNLHLSEKREREWLSNSSTWIIFPTSDHITILFHFQN